MSAPFVSSPSSDTLMHAHVGSGAPLQVTGTQPVAPVPVYPGGHAPHVNEPGELLQVVSESQPPFAVLHSFTSSQLVASFGGDA